MFYLNSLRRNWAQSAFTLLIVSFLAAALMFTGCKNEASDDNDNSLKKDLVGSWSSGTDYYDITARHITYGFAAGTPEFAGTIRHISNFTNNAGVIIIQYDNDAKPEYFEYDPVTYAKLSGPHAPLGDYYAIYFRDLTSSSVKLANASDVSGTDICYRCEAVTLSEAKKKFTADNVDNFVFDWSYVVVQAKQ